jgi:hypothetical protein
MKWHFYCVLTEGTQQCKLIFACNHVMTPMTKVMAFSKLQCRKKTSSILYRISALFAVLSPSNFGGEGFTFQWFHYKE